MTEKIARTVAHYGRNDPRVATGGVESFARGLSEVFEEVLYLTPGARDEARVTAERIPVVCDNHWVRDWPEALPVIGMQHGVALAKLRATKSREDLELALRQWRAARRPNTLWIASAPWVARTFRRLHGTVARHVVPHLVDLERFDGRLANDGSRLVLHDARAPHKGSRLVPLLAEAFPEWRFEGLDCAPSDVPDRMRGAAAFLHLSAYEGNSVVCNEAMAMDLPCLVTEVGLFRDATAADVETIPARLAFGPKDRLIAAVGDFLASLSTRRFHPRRFVVEHGSREAGLAVWRRVLADFDALGWGQAPTERWG